jgi:hypothetical protein
MARVALLRQGAIQEFHRTPGIRVAATEGGSGAELIVSEETAGLEDTGLAGQSLQRGPRLEAREAGYGGGRNQAVFRAVTLARSEWFGGME